MYAESSRLEFRRPGFPFWLCPQLPHDLSRKFNVFGSFLCPPSPLYKMKGLDWLSAKISPRFMYLCFCNASSLHFKCALLLHTNSWTTPKDIDIVQEILKLYDKGCVGHWLVFHGPSGRLCAVLPDIINRVCWFWMLFLLLILKWKSNDCQGNF